MGVVHLADDLVLDREVAVKVIEDRHPALVRREARIMAMVSHESVVQFYAHGENYLVMEYIDGHPLEIFLKRRISIEAWLDIAFKLCVAVDVMHKAGVVHRDIKPANSMLRRDHAPVLMDFGLATTVEDLRRSSLSSAYGTPDYLAPEAWRRALRDPAAAVRADVYALGMSLYQILTGQLPFKSGEALTVFKMHEHVDPSPPSVFRPGLPAKIDEVLLRSIARDPGERHQTAEELALEICGL